MSRLSSVGSVPISDRIKVFDKSGKARTGGGPPPTSPPKLPAAPSPFGPSSLTSYNRPSTGQYSAKDPTSGRSSRASTPSTPTPKAQPPRPLPSTPLTQAPPSASPRRTSEATVAPLDTPKPSGPVASPRKASVGQLGKSPEPRKASVGQSPEPRKVCVSLQGGSDLFLGPAQGEGLARNGAVFREQQRNGSSSSLLDDKVDRDRDRDTAERDTVDRANREPRKLSRKLTEEFLLNNNLGSNGGGPGLWEKGGRGKEHLRSREEEQGQKDVMDRKAGEQGDFVRSRQEEEEQVYLGKKEEHENPGKKEEQEYMGRKEEQEYMGRKEELSLDSEELPSFSSSVTEDVELVLAGRHRYGAKDADLEEQVEDLGQQVELLLKVKARLEAEVNQVRREHKREVADAEDELEDCRVSAAKKVKLLELQLEQEHEERLGFLRERHEMEGRIMSLKDALEHGQDEEQVRKLRRDLRKSKALLKDAQMLLDKQGSEGMNKLVMRQLKNQLEDSEFARTAALKARQNCELDLGETQTQLEDVCRAKADLEERLVKVGRERAELALQLRENEEEMGELIKKYKASVAAGSTDQITIQDQAVNIQELESQRNRAREQLAEAEQRVEHLRGESVSVAAHRREELRVRELESKLELERTSKGRLETQVGRLKEVVERQGKEGEGLRTKEKMAMEEGRKATKQWREAREEVVSLQGREAEWGQKRLELEKQVELGEVETLSVRNELKLAMRRVEDLQAAIQGEMDSETDLDDTHDSEEDTEDLFLRNRRQLGKSSRSSHFSPDPGSTAVSDTAESQA